ncbi:molybdopterin converting factor subunit 1 [Geminicoccaceae bacterium 1502E]|nr:molybdopterin converting factor subunit 1 [Geminicoccaceae bacterium 1502E]
MKVRYFAWLRQRTGCAEEEVSLPAAVRTVGDLMHWLGERHPRFAEACASAGVVRCAVNQDYVSTDAPVAAGDEVAFFPPVTGG